MTYVSLWISRFCFCYPELALSDLCTAHLPVIAGRLGTTIIELRFAVISEYVAPSPVSFLQRIVFGSIVGYTSLRCCPLLMLTAFLSII